MDKSVLLTEVGLRDGLQNLKQIISTRDKLHLLNSLIDAGLRRIQVSSFVNQKLIPQMADAEKLISKLPKTSKTQFSCLVLSPKGLDRALETGIKNIDFSISSSESYSLKNTRMSTKEALITLRNMIKNAKGSNINVRAGIQCVWGCVYDGRPNQKNLMKLIESILEMEPDVLSLADSSGMAEPVKISSILNDLLKKKPNLKINLHLHNNGFEFQNFKTALGLGINLFDTSFGGNGGSPFIKGSAGNLSTENAIKILKEEGYEVKINHKLISSISRWLKSKIC